jgi:hypothetical protein
MLPKNKCPVKLFPKTGCISPPEPNGQGFGVAFLFLFFHKKRKEKNIFETYLQLKLFTCKEKLTFAS